MPVGSKAFIPSTVTDTQTVVRFVDGKLTSLKTTDALLEAVNRVNELRAELAKLQEAVDSLSDLKKELSLPRSVGIERDVAVVAEDKVETGVTNSAAAVSRLETGPLEANRPEGSMKELGGGIVEIREEFDASFHGPITKKPKAKTAGVNAAESEKAGFDTARKMLMELEAAERESDLADHSEAEIRSILKMCANCDKPHSKSRCSRCKQVWYCSKTCQKHAWKEHKIVCKKTKKPVVEGTKAASTSEPAIASISEPVVSEIIGKWLTSSSCVFIVIGMTDWLFFV